MLRLLGIFLIVAALPVDASAHAAERGLFASGLDRVLDDGEVLEVGELSVRALHLPGHTAGQLGFLVDESAVFTGDTLFRGSVGGTRAPGHTTFEDLQHSIMEVLMRLPKETVVYPGHMEPTSIEREWQENPFVRAWRGVDAGLGARCRVGEREAELVVDARDYDGGTKCQVRYLDGPVDGRVLDVVPGSRVRRVSG